jgi:hypothetical protein
MSTCGMVISVSSEQLNIMSEHAITVAEDMKISSISDDNQHEINTAPPVSILVLWYIWYICFIAYMVFVGYFIKMF